MTSERARERKLAVILHADVVGSTGLVQRDETLAHERITDAFARFSETISSYRGTVHEVRGDALVAEFPRASDAVSAALAFQQVNAASNQQVTDGIAPSLRVGISLGEVVIADNTVTGPGVVLAQRVEQLAEPGGVCATAAIYEAAPGRLPFDYVDLGSQAAKGFDEPVQIYAVAMKSDASVPSPEPLGPAAAKPDAKPAANPARLWLRGAVVAAILMAVALLAWLQPWRPDVTPARKEAMAFALPEQPSIAVLPLDDFGGSKETEVIADGFSEHIINTLARIPELFVVARNSAFRYKGQAVEVRKVAEELGVQHVLEGSVQFDGDQMRLTAQLIDALSGKHVWSAHYDRPREDLFEVQDEVALAIARELQGKLTQGQMAKIRHRTVSNIEAWALGARAYTEFNRFGIPGLRAARRLAREAVEVDPNYAWPWVLIAYVNVAEIRFSLDKDRQQAIADTEKALAEAERLAPELPERLAAMSFLYSQTGRLDEAAAIWKEAEALAPNHAENLSTFSVVALFREEWQEVRRLSEKAMRLHPYYPTGYLSHAAFAYKHLGMEKEAIWAFEERAERYAKLRGKVSRFQLGDLAVCYATFGRWDDAKRTVARLLKEYPNHSAKDAVKVLRGWYPREALMNEQLDLLVQAGLPENPPLPLPDKPSIAVLPFDNLSNDPDQDFFAEGIAEDIITDLSKLGGLFVIAPNSSFSYKGKDLPLRAIARELGVKFVLDGSVRRAGNTLRINAQLIDAETGNPVWAERYDGAVSGVFDFQDEVTEGVVRNIAGALSADESLRIGVRMTSSVEAYDAYVQARQSYERSSGRGERTFRAHDLLREAVGLDPVFAEAYGLLASYTILYARDVSDWNAASLVSRLLKDKIVDPSIAELGQSAALDRTISELISKSLSFRDNAVGRRAQAQNYRFRLKDLHKAAAEFAGLIKFAPGDADGRVGFANVLRLLGRADEARRNLKEAMRLNPDYPLAYQAELGKVEFVLGDYASAVSTLRPLVKARPGDYSSRWYWASALALLGEESESKAALQGEVTRSEEMGTYNNNHPSRVRRRERYDDAEITERLLEGLRLAGMKTGSDRVTR